MAVLQNVNGFAVFFHVILILFLQCEKFHNGVSTSSPHSCNNLQHFGVNKLGSLARVIGSLIGKSVVYVNANFVLI